MNRRKFLLGIAGALALGFGVFGITSGFAAGENAGAKSACCCKGDSCPMKGSEAKSCCCPDCDCCKDGHCEMKSAQAGASCDCDCCNQGKQEKAA